MKPTHLLYMSGNATANATTGTTGASTSSTDSVTLTQTIFGGISDIVTLFGGVIRTAIETGHAAITERRRIIQEEINGLYNLDTNKNTNLGFVIIVGIAVIAVIAYKFVKEAKK